MARWVRLAVKTWRVRARMRRYDREGVRYFTAGRPWTDRYKVVPTIGRGD